MPRHLDRSHADAAARAEYENALSRLQMSSFDQRMPGGRCGGLPAGTFFKRKRWRQEGNGSLMDHPLLCQCATFSAGHHAISSLHFAHIGSDLDHFSGRFQSRHEGWIGTELIFALGHQPIGEIETCRMDLNPNFAALKRHDFPLQNLNRGRAGEGGAGSREIAGLHQFIAATISFVNASTSKRSSALS